MEWVAKYSFIFGNGRRTLSRVGRKPIPIPKDVKVTVKDNRVIVEGPKGTLEQEVHPEIKIENKDNTLSFQRSSENKFHRSLHGLYRSLINNNIIGVTEGFQKRLKIVGTGYKGEVKGKELILNLGYSHPLNFKIPEGIEIKTENPTLIVISGINKQKVGQAAANIRSFRPPEPYQGKGVRYEDEKIRRKAGKTGI
jgi:large subunit ribosomal protein L6